MPATRARPSPTPWSVRSPDAAPPGRSPRPAAGRHRGDGRLGGASASSRAPTACPRATTARPGRPCSTSCPTRAPPRRSCSSPPTRGELDRRDLAGLKRAVATSAPRAARSSPRRTAQPRWRSSPSRGQRDRGQRRREDAARRRCRARTRRGDRTGDRTGGGRGGPRRGLRRADLRLLSRPPWSSPSCSSSPTAARCSG